MKFNTARYLVAVLAVCLLVRQGQAQTTVDRVFPPIVAVGEETTVTAEGKLPSWPPGIFCDRDDVVVSAGEKSGKLTVRVTQHASPGVAWIRLYDGQSASGLIPLLVSGIPVTLESEPNDKRTDANSLSLPAIVAGRLAKGGDSDAYRVSVKAGQQLVVSVTANQVLKSPMDAVLQLSDVRGNVLFQSDDVCGLDPQIVYKAESDQECLLRVFAFPETPNSTVGFGGSAAFVYTIDVTTGPFTDHVFSTEKRIVPYGHNLPDEPVVQQADPTRISPVVATLKDGLGWSWVPSPEQQVRTIFSDAPYDGSLPVNILGRISAPGETHAYLFQASKGTKYKAEVRSKPDGFLIDSKLDFVEPTSGKVLSSNDDLSSGRYDAGLDFTAVKDGEIEVRVSDMVNSFGPRHFYRLLIREAVPGFQLSVAAEHFVITANKPIEISVTIARDSGFRGKIQVKAVGLPNRVEAESVVSESKGATAKLVKLKLGPVNDKDGEDPNSDPTLAAPVSFQILGTVLDDKDQLTERIQHASFPLRPAISLTDFCLIVPPASVDASEVNQPDKGEKP